MTVWNSGQNYQHDFESDGNSLRRFFIANQNLTISRLGNSKIQIIKKIQSIQNPEYWNNDWLYFDAWSNDRQLNVREKQCAECASRLFHCHLYNFEWAEFCPMHSSPLLNQCPKCGKPWPSGLDIAHRSCSVCGKGLPESPSLRKRMIKRLPEKQIALLGHIWKNINANHENVFVVYSDYVNVGLERGFKRTDPHFLSYLSTVAPNPMLEVISPSRGLLTKKSFSVRFVCLDDVDCILSSEDRLTDYCQVANKLDEWFKLKASVDPGKTVDRLRPLSFSEMIMDGDLTALALHAWRSIVLGKQRPSKVPVDWKRLFEELNIDAPAVRTTPCLLYRIGKSDESQLGRFYEIDTQFTHWLIECNLLSLLMYISMCIVYLKNQLLFGEDINHNSISLDNLLSNSPRFTEFNISILSSGEAKVLYYPTINADKFFRLLSHGELSNKLGSIKNSNIYQETECGVARRSYYSYASSNLAMNVHLEACSVMQKIPHI